MPSDQSAIRNPQSAISNQYGPVTSPTRMPLKSAQPPFCTAAEGGSKRQAGPQGSVVVRIVDRCPECAPGDVDMSPQAFAQIAPLVAGRVPITWHLVDPEITNPIRLHWKDGSSQWWGAIQVRHHRTGIFKLEYLSGGVFREINREFGCAVLVVTHDPRLSASCRRSIELVDGRIVRDTGVA